MTASGLAQMNWQVWVLDGLTAEDFSEQGEGRRRCPPDRPRGQMARDPK